jgi:outer membrane receptor for ferrienterochelin and colicins
MRIPSFVAPIAASLPRTRMVFLFLAPAGALMAAPTSADLADLSLEQLMEVRIQKVVSASKYEQKVTRAPAAVTIVTADEIAAFGHRTVADVLRSVRGYYASNDGNYSYIGVRGFLRPNDYNTRVLTLVDGHRMNDSIYDGGYIGRENWLDLDLVERVEVVRGPSSSIYGSSAFFGIINVVTKRGAQLEGGVVSAEVASFNTYAGRITVGGATKSGVDYLLSASRYTSGGRKQIHYPEFDPRVSDNPRATNNGMAENWDGEKAEALFSRITFRDLLVSASFSRREKEVPAASFSTVFNSRAEQTTDERGYFDAKYERSVTPDFGLLARVFYDNYRYEGDYPFDYAAPGEEPFPVLNKDFAHGEWAGAELQVNLHLGERYLLVAGSEFRENFHQDQINYDLEPRVDYLTQHMSGRTLGLYTQLEATVARNLVVNAGVRHDRHFASFGSTTNPRFAIIYNPSDRTALKALYGRAFRAPSVFERWFYSAQKTVPQLRPETIRTSELAWEQYLGHHYRLGVSAYHYEVDALINQSTTAPGALVFENLDGARATGAEIEFEGRWNAGTTARVSYARQRAIEAATRREMSASPRDLAKLNVIVPFSRERFTLGLEAQYHGEVITLDRNRVKDFAVGNVTIATRNIGRGWNATFSVYNLFDTSYGYPGAEDHAQDALPQEGRIYRLKLSHRF